MIKKDNIQRISILVQKQNQHKNSIINIQSIYETDSFQNRPSDKNKRKTCNKRDCI